MSTLSVTTINTANGTTDMTVASGNTSAGKLIVNSVGGITLASNSSTNAVFVTAGANVGIGNSSPGQKLTVAGTIESTTGGVKFPDGTTQTTAAASGNYQAQLFTSSGSWTAPTGVTKVKAWLIGAGGGGAYNGYYGSYNAGGYGGCCIGTYTVTPGTTYTITVGVAGTGVTGSTSGTITGNAGGSSSFGALATATGGNGATSSGAGSDVTPGADGSSSSGTLRNGSMASITFAMAPFLAKYTDYSPSTTGAITTWTISSTVHPGAPGYANGSTATGGVSGIVYLEWVG